MSARSRHGGQGELIALTDAMRIALTRGVDATFQCGLTVREHRIRCGLTTSDPDPMLTVQEDDTGPERWLADREQSGPERWDYRTTVQRTSDRFFLRLVKADQHADVPLVAAALAILSARGWTDDTSLTAEACVTRYDLDLALDSLVAGNF